MNIESDLRSFYTELKEVIKGANYFSSKKNNSHQIASVTLNNRSCGDSICFFLESEVELPKKNEKFAFVSLKYGGSFCCVCHASAEILCKKVNTYHLSFCTETREFSKPSFSQTETLLRQSHDLLADVLMTNRADCTRSFGFAELAQALQSLPSRTQCALLPIQAAIQLLSRAQEKVSKHDTNS